MKIILALLREAGLCWMEDNVMRLSAALSFYTVLSLAPLLVITIKIASVAGYGKESAARQMIEQIDNLMGAQAASAVKPIFENDPSRHSGSLMTMISAIILVFSATGVFVELQDSMNTIWGVKPKPGHGLRAFVRKRFLSFGMVFGVGFLLVLSIFVGGVLTGLGSHIPADQKLLGIIVNVIVPWATVIVLFSAIFKFLPTVKVQWKNVWPGALAGAVLFTAGKYALILYFRYAAAPSAYGAAGSLVVVLSWVYYSSFTLFYGAELTKACAMHHSGGQITPGKHVVHRNSQPAA